MRLIGQVDLKPLIQSNIIDSNQISTIKNTLPNDEFNFQRCFKNIKISHDFQPRRKCFFIENL